MSVMFSKVTLTADNGNTASLLCSGSPKNCSELEDWTAYQNFISDNCNSRSIKAAVETYLYGEGEMFIANEYEVAAFMRRGEGFLTHPDVHLQGRSAFSFHPPIRIEAILEC